MRIKLEDREYTLKANGAFMKKYQDLFGENIIIALYKCTQEQDIYTASKLTYCAINEDMSFEEWLDSFETPLFLITEMNKIIEYLARHVEPTVKLKGSDEVGSEVKKKTNPMK